MQNRVIKNIRIRKCLIITILALLSIFLFNKCMLAVSLGPITLSSTEESANWPKYTYTYHYYVDITINDGKKYDLSIYSTDSTSARVSGPGPSTIDYTTPKEGSNDRYQLVYPAGTGTPVNISSSDYIFFPLMTTTQRVYFDITYRLYEADCGGTQYSQSLGLHLSKNPGTTKYTQTSTLYFTIPKRESMTISTAPSISLTASQTRTLNQIYNMGTPLTATITTNVPWALQVYLSGDLSDNGNTIPYGSNYYLISGSGFTNLASTSTAFSGTGTYYNVASNATSAYGTGTLDNKTLSSKSVGITYGVKTTDFFTMGNYTGTTIFRLKTP